VVYLALVSAPAFLDPVLGPSLVGSVTESLNVEGISKKQNPMKFTLSYARALLGNDIDIQIEAEDGETINRVTVLLDGFQLSDELLQESSVSYQRTFLQAGSAGPHNEHKLTVAATDMNGNHTSATREWQDLN
jgi:hypothetical protein